MLTYFVKKRKKNRTKRSSQAVPLIALCNTNSFFFSLGIACQGLMIYLNGGIFIGLEY